ncbi:ecto-NOX disulfide-thiol exchanger 2-like isoform X2 [Zerene cesonia]|uniref:ecto-NOX disulfide-thiol exchanger 2-like isoform X2 n=1 Tax=Zerene cesonia TaxID=33412 RepID=UPI0018E53DEC|nr:ecto-NOX disulfide-thiol exchanger 2-like isoform X2 [Zerene cesonia]
MNLLCKMPLIGPVQPDMEIENPNEVIDVDQQKNDVTSTQSHSRQGERSRRDRDHTNRRGRSRSRDRYDRGDRRDRSDRSDRDRSDRSRRERERRSKWDNSTKTVENNAQLNVPQPMAMGNNMMIAGMMQYPQMMNNMMVQQQMDGSMANMMPQMSMMGGMMQNMMDPNMLMMNQQSIMPMPNQPIYINNAVLLPPIPGVTIPQRREKPKGCRTIFVGGLQQGVTPDTVSEIFQRFGGIEDVKAPRRGVFYVRFERPESVEQSFFLSGYRMKNHEQSENEATTMFVDYALNREDQNEYDRRQRHREPTPPKVEPFTPNTLNEIAEKIKSEEEFAKAAPTLATWLERGECNKKNANSFYSLIQTSNNQIRRLFNEKMQLDDELQNMKSTLKDKFLHVIHQFEQVAKILSAAKHQRVSDHFTKQQRRNIEMWLKMTEELENIKEEYNATFEDDDTERVSRNMVSFEKYEELKKENENLTYELEGYKNEAYLAKDEAERKFEKFKAHFIAQQALQNKQVYPPLPTPQRETAQPSAVIKPMPPPPTPDDNKVITTGPAVPPSEAKLISILTAFLMVHPLGASLDYLVSYVRSMTPNVTQGTVLNILQKYNDVFLCKTSGVGASIEHRWGFVTFDLIKSES